LFLWSHAAYPQLAKTLHAENGIDPEWIQSGLLIADCENRNLVQTWCESHTLSVEWPDPKRFSELEPDLALAPPSPHYLPDIAQVRNPRLLKVMRAEVVRLGGIIMEHQAVTELMINDHHITQIRTATQTYRAESYVIAAGAWSGQLAPLGKELPQLPIEPVKGQMIIFEAPVGSLRHIVLSEGRYLIPRKEGRILAGSTVEYTGFDKSTSDQARQELEAFARSLLPDVDLRLEKHWAGLRPGSPTGIPFIGPHPEIDNLFFNCGHFRNGFVMAPASARLLADLMIGRPLEIEPKPYRLMAER
jgi:glycine oxidase